MKDKHLSLETMANWLAGDLDHETLLGEVVPHFLKHCPTCRKRYEEILVLQDKVQHWDERVAVFEGLQAPELLAEIECLPFDEQLGRVADDSSLQTWGLCQLLIQRSLETVFEDPAFAVNLAELAVNISQNLGDTYDPHWVLDLRARAYAHLGNARRVLGEFRSAETAFRRSEGLLQRSMTGNDRIRAEVLDLKASLLRGQHHFGEALQIWDQSLTLYKASGGAAKVGDILVKKAKTLEDSGEPERAISELERAISVIDPADSRLSFYARHNLLACLILVGRFEEAARLLPSVQELSHQSPSTINLVRLQWAEARIAFGLGHNEDAESHFRQVQREFLHRGMAYDAALVSLDLAVVYAQEGRNDELRQLALEIIPIFEAQDVYREALAAMLMFQNACKEDRLTIELVHQIAMLLEQSRQPKSLAQHAES